MSDFSFQQAFEWLSSAIASVVFYAIPINGAALPVTVLWLVLGAVVFTCYLGFINIRGFRHAIRVVRGDYADKTDKGDITQFQALSAALSGTVGTGNIAGVAVAIALGGPGATFWMIVAGFLGMTTKFVECTLAVKYRQILPDGTVAGGPMYYIKAALEKYGLPRLGKVLAGFFALACVFGSAGFVHVNQGFSQVKLVTGFDNAWVFGLVYSFLVGLVIVGGIQSIARVTSKLVPLMCAIYLSAAFVFLAMHFDAIPAAIWTILQSAFAPEAAYGGVIGVIIQGFRRAAYSNEAGIGSSPIAHAAAKTKDPVSQGFVGLLEPFIDTVVICTMTALVIIFYNMDGVFEYGLTDATGNVMIKATGQSAGGVDLTTLAFDAVIPHFSYVLTVAIVLFAFSTMLSWSYYGLQAWKYLFGKSKISDLTYKVLFLLFIVVGAAATLDSVVKFSDAMILAMVFPNMIGLVILSPKVKEEMNKYLKAIKARFS